MSDWYTERQKLLVEEATSELDVTEEDFQKVYSFLTELGLIDYDIEKDIFWERYMDNEED